MVAGLITGPEMGGCKVSDLDTSLCTHFVYTFVGLNDDATIKIMDPGLELPDNYGKDNFKEFNKLKLKNPNLKTTVAIGGWREGSAKYSKMANDPTLRAKFVKEASSFVTKYGFDGLDVDWEYPGQRDSPNGNSDIAAFTQLLKELREEFDKNGLLVTAAVAATPPSAKLSYDIPEISKYFNYIHIMSYDFSGSGDGKTGHNSAMLAPQTSNDIKTVYNYWLTQGAPKEKLVMGLPLYGRTFKLTNPQDHSVGAPASGAGIAGPYTLERGMIGLNELCEKRLTENWPEEWDTEAQVPYTYKGDDWISYDDQKSLQIKAEYAMSLDLAGAMVWSIETDDFKRVCGGEKFSYIRAINKAIGRQITGNPSTTNTKVIESSTVNTTPAKYPIDSSLDPVSPSKPSSSTNNICVKEGFERDRNDCSVFYNCINAGNNQLKAVPSKCPAGLHFDLVSMVCNWPQSVSCN